MSEGMGRASCLPNLEESHLSGAGPVQTIHTLWHFCSLSLFQSLLLQSASGIPCLLSLHNHTEGGPLCKSDEKKSVSVEDL